MNNGGTMLTFLVRKYIQVYQKEELAEAKCPVPNVTDMLKGKKWSFLQIFVDFFNKCQSIFFQLGSFLVYASVRPFLYFDSLTSTVCQIGTSYWSNIGRSTVLVEVKFNQKVEVRFSWK